MKKVTIEEFMAFKPCYSKEKILEIAQGKKEWTALEVLALDIPSQDKLWAVLHEEFIDEPILHEFACQCAETALELIDKPDKRSIDAIAAKRAWLRGEIDDIQLVAAWRVASSAAYDAATAAKNTAYATQLELLRTLL